MLDIGDKLITPAGDPFVIAEISGNHNGDLGRALEIVRQCAAAGADAIKLQTYTADTITLNVNQPGFRLSDDHSLWGGRLLYDLYQEAATPWEWHEHLFAEAQKLGILAFSSPFDPTAVRFLADLGVPAMKIASSEITDLPLIRMAADTGLPVLISTGMASIAEIDRAIDAARGTGNDQLAILKCSAAYPAPPSETNLRAIPVLRDIFGVEVGYSDHTRGIGAAVAAVTLGASIIEKHVTLKRDDGGVDSAFSLEPHELQVLVESVRSAKASLGRPQVGPTPAEAEGLRFRRSLYVTQDVRAGDEVSTENVRSVRPAGGLAPDHFNIVVGRTFRANVPAGTPLTWDLL